MKRTYIWLYLALPFLLVLCSTANAASVFFYNQEGELVLVNVPGITDPAAAIDALVAGPNVIPGAEGLYTAILIGTRLKDFRIDGDSVTIEFSKDMVRGAFDEAVLAAAFKQISWTLNQFELDKDIKLTVNNKTLDYYLPPAPSIAPKKQQPVPESPYSLQSLSGHSITLSPGHGRYWNGSGWYTARPVYCSPLNEEDYHNDEMAAYLKTYLEQDGMTVKMCRQTDKNYGASPYNGGQPWWKMAATYWEKNAGYPCSVYASYTGDCTLGAGASESNDDIRARPLASDYDNTNIFITLHTNGYAGDCYGTSCPTGTQTYYDCGTEHAPWCTVSTNLANSVHGALIDAIKNKYPISTWHDRGKSNSNGAYGEIRIPDRAAILVELAFHDSCDMDAVYLQENFFRSTSMWGIYKGVCDYFGVAPTWGYYSDEYVSDDIPAEMNPGEVKTVHITFRNRGVLWTEAKSIRLGAVGDSDPFTTVTRQTISGEVGPNTTYQFTMTFTAPTTPGPYVTDWRMVRDGVTWFGATRTKTVQVTGGDTTPPSVPTNLTATAVGPQRINLSWTASTDNVGVTGYKIYRGGSYLTSTADTSYSNGGLSPSTYYSYTVSAYDAAGNESAQSSPASDTTPAYSNIIIDNPAATYTGVWSIGTSSPDKYLTNYHWASTAVSEGKTAKWTPTIAYAGNYDVYIWYPQGSNRANNSPFTVYWDGGSQTVPWNQQTNGGAWRLLLGNKHFAAGTTGYLKLGNGTGYTGKVVVADGARFQQISGD